MGSRQRSAVEVEIGAPLLQALEARARKQKTTVSRLASRLIAESLQELDDRDAVKVYRTRPGRTVPLAAVKKHLGASS